MPLPDTLLDPTLQDQERTELTRALKGAEIVVPGRRAPADDQKTTRLGCLVMLGLPISVGVALQFFTAAPAAFVAVAAVLVVAGGFALARRRRHLGRISSARRNRRLLVPAQDLDEPAQVLLRAAVSAARDVRFSRAYREGRPADGPALLEDQQWRIASALARLTEARRMVERTGGRVEEHRRMLRGTEEAVEARIRAMLAYARSVRRLDAALADLDGHGQSDLLEHRLREARLALGDHGSLSERTADTDLTVRAAGAALAELEDQADALRALGDSEP